MINVEINSDRSHLPLDQQRLREAVRMVLHGESLSRAEVSVAVVDDPTICRLHREYLDRDEPTDVLSFPLERGKDSLEGEIIVSADTAAAAADVYGWPAEDELLLYVIHGALHLVGYDDTTLEEKARMRDKEIAYLARLGLPGHFEDSPASSKGPVSGGD